MHLRPPGKAPASNISKFSASKALQDASCRETRSRNIDRHTIQYKTPLLGIAFPFLGNACLFLGTAFPFLGTAFPFLGTAVPGYDDFSAEL